MRTTILIALALACTSLRADITGLWNTDKNESQIEISINKTTQHYQGKIHSISDAIGDPNIEKTDINNPDPSKHNDPIIGLTLMQGFKKSSDKKYTGGTIYDPKSGKTYKCKITAKDADTITVRGYIGVSLVGKSTTWTRANE